MKYFLFLFGFSFFIINFFFVSNLSAGFTNLSSSTFIGTGTLINKVHGSSQSLFVHEDYIINPFEGQTISLVRDLEQGGITYYTVGLNRNGGQFNPQFSVWHPLFRSANTYLDSTWVQEAPGIRTRRQYLDNTYIGNVPNQSVRVRKYYQVNFNYDTTTPTCHSVQLYNDEAMQETYTYTPGTWVNSYKYFTVTCEDPETGCYCPAGDPLCITHPTLGTIISKPSLVTHKNKPDGKFKNNVLLENVSCIPPNSPEVLFDMAAPSLNVVLRDGPGNEDIIEDFQLHIESNREYELDALGNPLNGGNSELHLQNRLVFERKNPVVVRAGGNILSIPIGDIYYGAASLHGVSGIKNYKINLYRLTNNIHIPLVSEEHLLSCSRERSISNPYNPQGNITRSDELPIVIDCSELQISGKYRIIVEATDFAENYIKATSELHVYPNIPVTSQSSVETVTGNTVHSKIFANNNSFVEYTVGLKDLYGNPVYNRLIDSVSQDISSYTGGKSLFLNMTTQSGPSALRYGYATPITTDLQGKFTFRIYSYAPGTFTEHFRVRYRDWDNFYLQDQSYTLLDLYLGSNEREFHKPILGSISLEFNESPQIAKDQKYTITLTNTGSIASLSNASLNIIPNNTVGFSTEHRFSRFNLLPNNTFTLSSPTVSFSGTIQPNNPQSALITPQLSIPNLPIQYSLPTIPLDGSSKSISYYLDDFEANSCERNLLTTLGVSIVGNLQGDGKSDITGQEGNFSDISSFSQRTQMRQNAYNLIRGRTSGTIVNDVRYVEGDITISGNPSYETLIVKNGNVFISGNLDRGVNSVFGIIVLKDEGYNLTTDYNRSGNVYIAKEVDEINAFIYTDGTVRSARANGQKYTDSEIRNPLLIKGSLFTRNTIGGAIHAGTNYLLPGGTETSDFSLAEIYDLNSIRKTDLCESPFYSLRIEYDQRIIETPPIGFSSN